VKALYHSNGCQDYYFLDSLSLVSFFLSQLHLSFKKESSSSSRVTFGVSCQTRQEEEEEKRNNPFVSDTRIHDLNVLFSVSRIV